MESWQHSLTLSLPDMVLGKHQAGVLVLCERHSEGLILTQRAKHLKDHAGEFCFVGGTWQRGDEDILQTALRETHEELGIEPARIDLLSVLPSQLSVKGIHVTPMLALIDSLHPFKAQADEVAKVVTVPLEEVLNEGQYDSVLVERGGHRVKSLRFRHEQHFIWGLTAKIMHDLASLYGRMA